VTREAQVVGLRVDQVDASRIGFRDVDGCPETKAQGLVQIRRSRELKSKVAQQFGSLLGLFQRGDVHRGAEHLGGHPCHAMDAFPFAEEPVPRAGGQPNPVVAFERNTRFEGALDRGPGAGQVLRVNLVHEGLQREKGLHRLGTRKGREIGGVREATGRHIQVPGDHSRRVERHQQTGFLEVVPTFGRLALGDLIQEGVNSSHALRGGGCRHFEVDLRSVPADPLRFHPELTPGADFGNPGLRPYRRGSLLELGHVHPKQLSPRIARQGLERPVDFTHLAIFPKKGESIHRRAQGAFEQRERTTAFTLQVDQCTHRHRADPLSDEKFLSRLLKEFMSLLRGTDPQERHRFDASHSKTDQDEHHEVSLPTIRAPSP
jgi:hypothetical protein